MRIFRSLLIGLVASSCAFAYTAASKHLNEKPEWYTGDEAKSIADFILQWQTTDGGWPKNVDTTTQPWKVEKNEGHATYDNSAGFYEMQYLLKMYQATKDPKYSDSINRYIDYLLIGQYENGGWPQSYPAPEGYGRYITFNDGAMQRVMFQLRDVYNTDQFDFAGTERKAKAKAAWDKGVQCILKCQVKVDGKLTVWCAQHNEKDFKPAPARKFEPVSLSGQESLSVMNVLMQVENPSPEVIAAVDAAAAWFDAVRIKGIRIEDRKMDVTPEGVKTTKGFERYVVEDKTAPDLWARFYEIGTNKPIFMGRDSVVKYNLADIEIERRTGYKWYGAWATNRLEKEYPAWKAKVSASAK